MPTFIDLLLKEISQKAPSLFRLWERQALSKEEETLFQRARDIWLGVPASPGNYSVKAFACDGSMIERSFNNGATIFIGQALLIGNAIEEKNLRVDLFRGGMERGTIDRLNSIFLKELEVSLCLENMELMEGGVLFLDGSLYSTLPHLLYPVSGGREISPPDPALDLLEKILRLLEKAEELKVKIICLSKSSHDLLLSRKLSFNSLEDDIPEEELLKPQGEVISDSELLFRSTKEPGFSRPLIVGKMSFYPKHSALFLDFRELAKRFSPEEEKALPILEKILDSPAHGILYWRPSKEDDPIRVDFPWTFEDERIPLREIFGIFPRDFDKVFPILSQVQSFYGGSNVYNALLWQADRAVRLTRELSEIYLGVISSKLGERLKLDRSSRRFL